MGENAVMNGIIGQDQAAAILEKIRREQTRGRTLILLGDKGTGKFSLAADFARDILNKNPFLSADFKFYRNDDFSLKTRFFINNINVEALHNKAVEYFYYLLGRISNSIAYNETGKSSIKLKKIKKAGQQKGSKSEAYGIADFRNDLEEILINGKFIEEMSGNTAFVENCIIVSDEVSKKERIPIDFVRDLIAFNSLKSQYDYKVSVIGNFENATEEAQNSGLKLFEEPSDRSIIILTANSIDNILPTILSRSVIIKMNKLSPSILKKIFGAEIKGNFFNTVDYMEDGIYHYTQKKRDRVIDFFSRIAPKIQYETEIFSFIEEITSEENNKLSLLFMQELIEFYRNLHLARQEYIRKSDYTEFIDKEYKKLSLRIIPNTHTGEIHEIVSDIGNLLQTVRYNNITERIVLPSLLINLARWYQKRNKG